MPWYMAEINYQPEHVRAMLQEPQDRSEAGRKLIEALGGKLHHYFFVLGESQIIVIAELPDDVAMQAGALAVIGIGGSASYKTTKLLTVADAMEGMRKAGQVTGVYKPVGG